MSIGFILSLSGSWADFGQAQQNALIMAKRERQDLFGNIRFIIEDCGYRPASAVAAFQKLAEQDHADAVFVWGVEPALAVAPLAESRKLPLFVSALDPRTALRRRFVMRTINPASEHSERLAAYMEKKRIQRIGVVLTDASFFQVLYDQLRAALPAAVQTVIEATHPASETDYRTTIARLKSKRYDAVAAYLDPKQVPIFFRQAREQSLAGPFFGTTTFQSRDSIKEAGGAMEGAVFAHNYVEEQFRNRFAKEFGTDHQIPWAANAYDFAIMMGEEFGRAGALPRAEDIVARVRSSAPRSGVGGNYRALVTSEDAFFQYPVVMYQIAGGDYRVLEEQ